MRDSVVKFEPDFPYWVRQYVGPGITRLARTIGQPEYRIRRTEYVGTVRLPMEELIAELRAGGFAWGPFSWYHQPPVETDPNGSWTYRRSLLADRQLHVVLSAQAREHVAVYAHEEYNWLRHPVKHGKQVGIDREKGAAEMRRWLETRGLDISDESRIRRHAVRLLHRFRERLATSLGLR
jgi:hypothetical protein